MYLKDLTFYSLAEAKAKLSQVVDEVENKDIVITKNGVPKVILLDYDKFVKLMEFVDEVRDISLFEVENVEEYKRIKDFFKDFDY
ncbi:MULTISPECIES: type II toxin-antitoxin system Phd/YefM family antitoxin [Petrotoga]|uniref:Antitoxin n=2 Tax=Petrotoga sibirica TaxID=156202 RepID=A0A4R8EHP1_9BACT|nr:MULTISPECIES: type II toxin-antitoxin system Phd/YefM family antitoxin [Petrotoga]POZ88126.1 prevent-host-death protein [Petrotoga sibirica DSM 13575]POZ89866.1 prevent-host-death protein [Petrotoga sp. SL27]TDX11146.1 prevent-host-death family protein [Petrotoga sibirica]